MDNKRLTLVAMIFAVAMMFIDQTIVALAIPDLQRDLSLSATGAQWIINGYLLALSALFALGGKLADVLGHRRMVLVGVAGFALFSALCGATPTGSIGEAWMIFFRILQGASAALLFPAALAIVVSAYPLRERGKALAIFFAASGGLTAVGPLAGGYLTEWTWRAIFWINVPVAIVAIVLTLKARPAQATRKTPIDYRGAVLISIAMGLAVLGLQQAGVWGWDDARTWACIVAGLVLLAVFVLNQLRVRDPLIQMRIFSQRAFSADNVVLFLISAVFVPLFFFASVYAQVSLGYGSSEAGLFLLVFFAGFATASQWGGRILDERGAKPSVVLGCAVSAVGFFLWARQLPDMDFSNQWYWLAIAGAGMGLVLGPVSTDAVNRAPNTSYGEVTGITQTVRNFGASLGLAILGSVLVTQNVGRIEDTLTARGIPTARADAIAHSITSSSGGDSSPVGAAGRAIFEAIQLDVAKSTQVIVYAMAGIMVVAFVVARIGMPKGRVEEVIVADDEPEGAAATA
ncbi:DHA2 family efflux MFS transporter permease subunit [Conexibacter sp. CPCC 206217]|uniref:DHA2 family efflux MFS transporter permease subunit n=1 Tax=Conexibacter sp. CPCC 206217 TaxID=3064574 RepID=UPI0027234A47|nr:DHA2 family efflux MFS transporter permease subunit [Conexibacter sp. CPCC 206217]MDO8213683.1 DHA2 family efflux MFS transporter permease subunit [Conexibacter sp. CPCC 206217]